jgi:hypothetical protein
LGAVVVFLAGCYTLQPARNPTPEVGSLVAFDVNDQGRVALGGSIGPEIGQIEGRLLDKDSASYLLSISAVRLLRGGEQPWNGEQVRVRTEHLSRSYEKRFSLGRTIAMGAVAVGGFAAFFATRSLLGAGDLGDGDGNGNDTNQTKIGRIRQP